MNLGIFICSKMNIETKIWLTRKNMFPNANIFFISSQFQDKKFWLSVWIQRSAWLELRVKQTEFYGLLIATNIVFHFLKIKIGKSIELFTYKHTHKHSNDCYGWILIFRENERWCLTTIFWRENWSTREGRLRKKLRSCVARHATRSLVLLLSIIKWNAGKNVK